MSDLCHRCEYHELVNEARDTGAQTWLSPNDPYGVNVFVIPEGARPDVHLHRDGTFGPQRRVWFNELPERCECGAKVKLRYPPSDWKPDMAAAAAPEPEPMFEPAVERETLSLI